MSLMFLRVLAGLGKAEVGPGFARSGNVRHQAIEHHASLFVLVKALVQEIPDETTAL
jgi:hypothetical protein